MGWVFIGAASFVARFVREPGMVYFHGQQGVGEQRHRQFFGSRHRGRDSAKELDGVDVSSEVIEIVEGGVGEHEMKVAPWRWARYTWVGINLPFAS